MIWCNRDCLVINRYSDIVMTISAKGYFAWYFASSDRPASWYFVWYFDCLISLTSNCCRMNNIAILVNVIDVSRLLIRHVGNYNCLIISFCSNRSCWYSCLTSSVAWYGWHLICFPGTSCPVTVSYFASCFINISGASQLNFLSNCLSLAIWGCDLDRSSNCTIQVIMFNTLEGQ